MASVYAGFMSSTAGPLVDPSGVQSRLSHLLGRVVGDKVGDRMVVLKGGAGVGKSTHANAALRGFAVTELNATMTKEACLRTLRNFTMSLNGEPPALIVEDLESFFCQKGLDKWGILAVLSLIHI